MRKHFLSLFAKNSGLQSAAYFARTHFDSALNLSKELYFLIKQAVV
jgi:hypothetical protein